MKRKWIYIAFIVFLVLFISSYLYGLFLNKSGERDFAISRELNVTAIHIIPSEGESILLEKDRNEQRWFVDNNLYANEFAVRDLIRTLRFCAVRQPVSLDSRAEINRDLNENGVLVDVYADAYLFNFFEILGLINIQRRVKSIIVGRNTKEIEGTYMKIAGNDKPYIVNLPGYSKGIAGAFTSEKRIWINPEIINLEADQIKEVEIINNEQPDESFVLSVGEDIDFEFLDLNGRSINKKFKIDTLKVLRYLSSFKGLYYESLLEGDDLKKSEQLIFPDHAFIVSVTDINQNHQSFMAYRKHKNDDLKATGEQYHDYDPDRFYIELENGKRAIAQYYIFGRILRQLSFFKAN